MIKEFEHDETRRAMRNLTNIWGVGPSMAAQLQKLGYRNIQEIRDALEHNEAPAQLLTENMKVGVQFYEEFKEKMDR